MALIDRLNAIGDAIREKNGTTKLIPLVDMPQAILDIVGGGEVDGGDVTYTNIVYNEDNTITLTDTDGVVHTMECEYTDGKLTSVKYDGKKVDLTYDGDVLVKVGETNVDMANVPTEMGALENLIDNSGVLEDTEGSVSEKVEQLIDLVEENILPDWDDDSPIIASGYGYYEWVVWELTEKGTMRWKQDKTNPKYNPNVLNTYNAGWNDSGKFNVLPDDYWKVSNKVRQIYIPDGFTGVHLGYALNCKRIRLPETLTNDIDLKQIPVLKELDFIDNGTINIGFSYLSSIEKITLSPNRKTVMGWGFDNMTRLRDINLENITDFRDSGFVDTPLGEEIVFSADLIQIQGNAFHNSRFKSVKFQTPTSNMPTISAKGFIKCGNLKDIYVPWSEGEVANAPWGATKATIHYNYVEGEETNAES